MRFTTPVELKPSRFPISHDEPMVMLGSCFTDNIGSRLVDDGFNVEVNPMGVLFNPASLAKVVTRALENRPYRADDLVELNGIWHCLDFHSRRQDRDMHSLLSSLNDDFFALGQSLRRSNIWVITFGTAWVFDHIPSGQLVGNCHKIPMDQFNRRRLSVDEIVDAWAPLCKDRRVIFTVSPVRHLADGLPGNALSKATLLLAVEQLCTRTSTETKEGKKGAEYFPAFEIVNDELRDYRFYAADMKHPSEVAVDYIYDRFASVYFSPETRLRALEARRDILRQNHRPIL